jgi:hypothetical protein
VEAPFRDPRFDLPALVLGALGTAALTVGLGAALLYLSRTNTSPDTGATAATMSDAFSAFAGIVLGMLAGCGLTAYFCRRGSRIATGILAGFLAWAVGLVPTAIATRARDLSVGEAFDSALVLGLVLTVLVIMGAGVGAAIGAERDRRRRGLRPGATSA